MTVTRDPWGPQNKPAFEAIAFSELNLNGVKIATAIRAEVTHCGIATLRRQEGTSGSRPHS